MTDNDIRSRIEADPDAARELTPGRIARMKRTVPTGAVDAREIRKKLNLSQPVFSNRFRIPIDTLRQWERQRRTPDAAARAYLLAIERDPEGVARSLAE